LESIEIYLEISFYYQLILYFDTFVF